MSRFCRSISYLRGLYSNASTHIFKSPLPSYQRYVHVASMRNEKRSIDSVNNNAESSGAVPSRYEIFKDESSPIIFDVEEEREMLKAETPTVSPEDEDIFAGISPERGITGVIEIHELVEILRKEQAADIFVAKVPAEYHYVNFIVIVCGRSVRHMKYMAEFLRRVFKYKKHEKDIIPMMEGKKSEDWLALDLGNIAVHILSTKARKYYDLETLWTVGREFDSQLNVPADPLKALLEQSQYYMGDLTPADADKQDSLNK